MISVALGRVDRALTSLGHARSVRVMSFGWARGAVLVGLLVGCGGQLPPESPLLTEPPAVAEPVQVATVPPECPEGSSFDSERAACVATAPIAASKGAGWTKFPPDPEPKAPPGPAGPGINVSCAFPNGWVSVMPVRSYPKDDQFLMQALIGITEEPSFWSSEPEYRSLIPFAAKKCTEKELSFAVPDGDYFILAGETGTFGARGDYTRNGFKRRVTVKESLRIALQSKDLTHTWVCISCPFVSFFDGAELLPAFVVLANRSARSRRGTDRILVEKVPVQNGKIRLRVAEADHEVTRLDRLVLEVGGQILLPTAGGSRSALADADDVDVEMSRGKQILVEYAVPAGVADGVVDVRVIAHGHYDPTEL